MFHSRSNNNEITHLHERYLGLIYSDNSSSYEELLKRNWSVSIHHKNIQTTAIGMFENLNGMSLDITNDLFEQRIENHNNLCHIIRFNIPHIRTVHYGSESLWYLRPNIFNIAPERFKKAKSLMSFKELIKSWKPLNFRCRLCKTYNSLSCLCNTAYIWFLPLL